MSRRGMRIEETDKARQTTLRRNHSPRTQTKKSPVAGESNGDENKPNCGFRHETTKSDRLMRRGKKRQNYVPRC